MGNRTLDQIVDDCAYGLDAHIAEDLLINVKLRMHQCATAYAIQELLNNQEKINEILENAFNKETC